MQISMDPHASAWILGKSITRKVEPQASTAHSLPGMPGAS